ncbi:MAG: SDR family oxidoreductase [Treponema sp.]|nr:SDR family oxidoreductase [Treponema sp.]
MAYTIDLSNQVAFVTGGIRGIGLAISKTLAIAGATIAICDILPEDDPAVIKGKEELEKIGASFYYISRDLSIETFCREAIDLVIAQFGRLDIFIANAGITGKDGNWDAAFDLNVKGIYFCYERAKEHLERVAGRIVIISSASIFTGGTGIPEYIATKGGTQALVRYIAREGAPIGIRVNAVAPAVIMTEMTITRFGSAENMLKHYEGKLPLGRIGTVEDVANAVLYLASDMSNWTCGETLVLDGGRLHLS